MKIATWNLMRPTAQTLSRNKTFFDELSKCDADILVLTETNSIITPAGYEWVQTKQLPEKFEGFAYKEGENRASIFSRYPFGRFFETYDPYTSVCSEVLTPQGPLLVYATIIGVTGGRGDRFRKDFDMQKQDIQKLAGTHDLCVAGDFNISFTGYAYPSKAVIKEATDFFDVNGLEVLTKNIADIAEQITISRKFIGETKFIAREIFRNDKISDHGLIEVDLDICKDLGQ